MGRAQPDFWFRCYSNPYCADDEFDMFQERGFALLCAIKKKS